MPIPRHAKVTKAKLGMVAVMTIAVLVLAKGVGPVAFDFPCQFERDADENARS
jgi:hypothetical protein